MGVPTEDVSKSTDEKIQDAVRLFKRVRQELVRQNLDGHPFYMKRAEISDAARTITHALIVREK